MAVARFCLIASTMVAMLLSAGCGKSSLSSTAPRAAAASPTPAPSGRVPGGHRAAPPSGTVTLPTPGPTGIVPAPSALAVIRGWSSSLARGDVTGAAGYFALPSEMINGPDAGGRITVIAIHSRRQAVAANLTLSCAATFLHADQRGRYVNAVFTLGDRPGSGAGSGCGGIAQVNFVIRGGQIVRWIRAPDDDQSAPQPPGSPSPTVPESPGSPAPSAPATGNPSAAPTV